MIEFIQDYVTKSLPPETFEDGQRVKRSPESENYFVRLGVAAYVIDDKLVGQDYAPIVRQPVAVVVSTDRRFAGGGRAGEVIGLDAPQRATSGPGNAVVFSGQPDSVDLAPVEVEQLRADLAASIAQLDEHRTSSASELEALTSDLASARGDREVALADLARTQQELAEANAEGDEAVQRETGLQQRLDVATVRIAELERQLAEQTSPATGSGQSASARSGKAK